jgi:hypothetical protein
MVVDGFAVGMSFGISARMFPGFLGIDPATAYPAAHSGYRRSATSDAGFWLSVAAWSSGVAATAAGYLLELGRLRGAGEWLFDAGCIGLALRYGLGRRSKHVAIDRSQDPLFPLGARAAYALLVSAVVIGGIAGGADLFGSTADPIWRDVRRHLIALGFLLTLITTMAGRLAPGYAGRPLAWPGLRMFALLGFPVSAILRAAEGFANLWGMPSLLWVSAASGLLAAAAFVALTGCVVATLLTSRRSPTPSN